MALLHVVASGNNRQVGYTHGILAKDKISKSIDFYKAYFKSQVNLDWTAARLIAAKFAKSIEADHPDLFEELEGVAEGSGFDILDIVALNARSEIVFSSNIDGCTAFAWKGTNGDQWSGQNWDWKSAATDTLIYLDIQGEKSTGRPGIKIVVEAGIIGKIGLNEHGVSLMLNAISTTAANQLALPIHLVMRRLLEQKSVPTALDYLSTKLGGLAASTGHILLADPNTAVSVEVGPQGTALLEADEAGLICHSNHLVQLDKKLEKVLWLDSFHRLDKIRELTHSAVKNGEEPSHLGYRTLLSDRSAGEKSICRHESDRGIDTVFSISVDGKAKRAEVIMGRPDEGGEIVIMSF